MPVTPARYDVSARLGSAATVGAVHRRRRDRLRRLRAAAAKGVPPLAEQWKAAGEYLRHGRRSRPIRKKYALTEAPRARYTIDQSSRPKQLTSPRPHAPNQKRTTHVPPP